MIARPERGTLPYAHALYESFIPEQNHPAIPAVVDDIDVSDQEGIVD